MVSQDRRRDNTTYFTSQSLLHPILSQWLYAHNRRTNFTSVVDFNLNREIPKYPKEVHCSLCMHTFYTSGVGCRYYYTARIQVLFTAQNAAIQAPHLFHFLDDTHMRTGVCRSTCTIVCVWTNSMLFAYPSNIFRQASIRPQMELIIRNWKQ